MSDFFSFMQDPFLSTGIIASEDSPEQQQQQQQQQQPQQVQQVQPTLQEQQNTGIENSTSTSSISTTPLANSNSSSSSSSSNSNSNNNSSGSGGWWGSVLTSVLQTSEQLIQQTKRDLSEFVHVIQYDTQQAVAETASKLHHQLEAMQEEEKQNSGSENGENEGSDVSIKKTVSHLLGTITASIASAATPTNAPIPSSSSSSASSSSLLTIGALNSLSADSMSLSSSGGSKPTTLTRSEALLHALQVDPLTYTTDVSPEEQESFKSWLTTFVLEQKTDEISHLLSENSEVRSLHARLVPASVSYTVFWQRYFYRVHQLREEENRRTKLKERMESSVVESFNWDDEDGDNAESHISPTSPASLSSPLAVNDTNNHTPKHSRQVSDAASSDDEIIALHQMHKQSLNAASNTAPTAACNEPKTQTKIDHVADKLPDPTPKQQQQQQQQPSFSSSSVTTSVLPSSSHSQPQPQPQPQPQAPSTISVSLLQSIHPPNQQGAASNSSSRSVSRASTDSFELVASISSLTSNVTTPTTTTTTHTTSSTGETAEEDDDWETWE